MTLRVWGCSVRGIADAALFAGVLVGVALLAGFVRTTVQQPPYASQPFFSNDQAGLFKVLVVIVGPIVVSLGAWMWKLARSDEQADINKIGEKINGLTLHVSATDARMNEVAAQIAANQLANQAALFESQKGLMEQMGLIQNSLARIETRVSGVERDK